MNYVLTHRPPLIVRVLLWALFIPQLPWSASASDPTGEIDPQAKIIEIKFYIDGKLLEESPRLKRLHQICEISAGEPFSAYAVSGSLKAHLRHRRIFPRLKFSEQKVFGGIVLKFRLTEKGSYQAYQVHRGSLE